MKLRFPKNKIEFRKELSDLDKFVVEFTSILNRLGINYVIVSGYVAILFGRNRTSEDIDIIMEKLDLKRFNVLFSEVGKKFECITTHNPKEAYHEYLSNHTSIRFSRIGEYIPNIEIKFANDELNQLDSLSLNENIKVKVNGHEMAISPIELQIAFKFFLGSEKDIEDAVYLYEIFRDKIDSKLLLAFGRKLNILNLIKKHIK